METKRKVTKRNWLWCFHRECRKTPAKGPVRRGKGESKECTGPPRSCGTSTWSSFHDLSSGIACTSTACPPRAKVCGWWCPRQPPSGCRPRARRTGSPRSGSRAAAGAGGGCGLLRPWTAGCSAAAVGWGGKAAGVWESGTTRTLRASATLQQEGLSSGRSLTHGQRWVKLTKESFFSFSLYKIDPLTPNVKLTGRQW